MVKPTGTLHGRTPMKLILTTNTWDSYRECNSVVVHTQSSTKTSTNINFDKITHLFIVKNENLMLKECYLIWARLFQNAKSGAGSEKLKTADWTKYFRLKF